MFKRSSYLAIALALAATTILSAPANAKSSKKTVKGPAGQTLTVSATSVRDGQTVSVTGKKYSKKVGIYLAYCVLNKKGEYRAHAVAESTHLERQMAPFGYRPIQLSMENL
jgi:hypothetical protein